MSCLARWRRAATSAACAVAVLCACSDGGSLEAPPPQDAPPTVQGMHVADRDEALQIAARGVVTPLVVSEAAHAVLARAFELRGASGAAEAAPGDRWLLTLHGERFAGGPPLTGQVAIEIVAADRAQALLSRGEPGFVRAVLSFEPAGPIDGAITLEVSRRAGSGLERRSQADALRLAGAQGAWNWSYLDVTTDARGLAQKMAVVSDVPLDGAGRVWLDVIATAPGHYVATGVVGFLQARLSVRVGTDATWTIEVDNDKDGGVDLGVQASAVEARALMP